ncbi:hypothetical protein [Kutzneria kofuensis]|uniref:JAB domain-containing protein n=1 Tax=Kutzneria kofuensis TaxID=103725 RepID=A0A7W9NL17_9PSEU|nr:hypothetical protein [Kutzneria kofuensis]MBB5895838.1 hypothetical protein [Kutzneria kofuensis]
MPSHHTPAVVVCPEVVEHFLDTALPVYETLTPDHPLPCFAVLLGESAPATIHVRRLAFGANARTTSCAAIEEFATTIVPKFGSAYENADRGYWLDPADLLRINREAERSGLDILGSIHMHPDWHRITRVPAERACTLSSRPTAMDEHVFAATGWPVNVICYLEQVGGLTSYNVEAWDPGGAPLPLRTGVKVVAA